MQRRCKRHSSPGSRNSSVGIVTTLEVRQTGNPHMLTANVANHVNRTRPSYCVPDQGSFFAYKACIRWDIPRELPSSGTRQKRHTG